MEILLKFKKPTFGWFACSAWLWLLPAVILFSVLLTSCGGGGATPQAPPPSGDFSLSVTPTSVSIQPGGSATAALSATGSNGFDSVVGIQITGLPTGVTVAPSTVTLTPVAGSGAGWMWRRRGRWQWPQQPGNAGGELHAHGDGEQPQRRVAFHRTDANRDVVGREFGTGGAIVLRKGPSVLCPI